MITEELEIPSKVFRANFNQTWQAVLQVVKKYDIEHQSLESGVIRSKWIDNTGQLNFSDSFSSNDAVKGAKFKLIINVTKGLYVNQEISKVAILKRQLVEADFLQGWKEIPTDKILERILLYRISRVIDIDNQLNKIEEKKAQDEMRNLN